MFYQSFFCFVDIFLVCRGLKLGVLDNIGKILFEFVVEKGVIIDDELFLMFFELNK